MGLLIIGMTTDGLGFLSTCSTIGIILVGLGFCVRKNELAARGWAQASGMILTSRVQDAPAPKGGREFFPVIEYEFSFDGQTFKTSHWRVGNYSLGQRETAETITSCYPAGSRVNVFVNPKHPAKSVLEYGTSPLSWIPLVLGTLLIALASLPLFVK